MATTTIITKLTFFLTISCLILLIVSFSTNKWFVSSLDTGFLNIGLWSVCFRLYFPPPWGKVTRRYDGCWWSLNKELDDLRHYLFPSWFRTTQGLVTFSLILVLLSIITMIVNVINCFPYSAYRRQLKVGISALAAGMMALTSLLLMIAVIMFGVRADTERQWLEDPDNNFLGWSYMMAIGAAFLAIFASMAQLLEFCRLRSDELSDEPQVYLTDQAPPSSKYIYSARPVEAVTKEHGQPQYAQRYAESSYGQNGQGQGYREPQFKVSGSGEVYVNRLADRDERDHYAGGRAQDTGNGVRSNGGYDNNRRTQDNNGHGRYDDDHDDKGTDDGFLTEETLDDDYDADRSRRMKHPVLPEYVAKPKLVNQKNNNNSHHAVDEKSNKSSKSASKDDDSSDFSDEVDNNKRKSSKSKSKKDSKSSKPRSSSKKKKKKGYDSDESTSKKKKKKAKRDESSEDDRSRSKKRSRSSSKTRKNGSRSRNLDASFSEDSDAKSTRSRSRSRQRHNNKNDSSKKSSKKRSSSNDRSRSKDRLSESGKKKKNSGAMSDDGSNYSRKSRTKSRNGDREKGNKSRDFSDSESTRSRRTGGDKPKGQGYSSYYEY